MSDHRVLYVSKSYLLRAHERVKYIGGKNSNGIRWKISQEKAIEGIESGQMSFWVRIKEKPVRIIVATSAAGNKYIKTTNDGIQPNDLLGLPMCPR